MLKTAEWHLPELPIGRFSLGALGDKGQIHLAFTVQPFGRKASNALGAIHPNFNMNYHMKYTTRMTNSFARMHRAVLFFHQGGKTLFKADAFMPLSIVRLSNDYCAEAGKPLVYESIHKFSELLLVLLIRCMRFLFDEGRRNVKRF